MAPRIGRMDAPDVVGVTGLWRVREYRAASVNASYDECPDRCRFPFSRPD